MARSVDLPAGFFAPNRPCDVGALARFEIPFRQESLVCQCDQMGITLNMDAVK